MTHFSRTLSHTVLLLFSALYLLHLDKKPSKIDFSGQKNAASLSWQEGLCTEKRDQGKTRSSVKKAWVRLDVSETPLNCSRCFAICFQAGSIDWRLSGCDLQVCVRGGLIHCGYERHAGAE